MLAVSVSMRTCEPCLVDSVNVCLSYLIISCFAVCGYSLLRPDFFSREAEGGIFRGGRDSWEELRCEKLWSGCIL